jgi:hypothetical protein
MPTNFTSYNIEDEFFKEGEILLTREYSQMYLSDEREIIPYGSKELVSYSVVKIEGDKKKTFFVWPQVKKSHLEEIVNSDWTIEWPDKEKMKESSAEEIEETIKKEFEIDISRHLW